MLYIRICKTGTLEIILLLPWHWNKLKSGDLSVLKLWPQIQSDCSDRLEETNILSCQETPLRFHTSTLPLERGYWYHLHRSIPLWEGTPLVNTYLRTRNTIWNYSHQLVNQHQLEQVTAMVLSWVSYVLNAFGIITYFPNFKWLTLYLYIFLTQWTKYSHHVSAAITDIAFPCTKGWVWTSSLHTSFT